MGMLKEFKDFAMKGNVVDMAVGIIIGAAFGKIVSSLVADVVMPQVYEHGMPEPWTFDGEGTFAERMMTQIVGFRMLIEKIEGKFKLSQNQPLERRQKVIRRLEQQSDENSLAVAELMRARLTSTAWGTSASGMAAKS